MYEWLKRKRLQSGTGPAHQDLRTSSVGGGGLKRPGCGSGPVFWSEAVPPCSARVLDSQLSEVMSLLFVF